MKTLWFRRYELGETVHFRSAIQTQVWRLFSHGNQSPKVHRLWVPMDLLILQGRPERECDFLSLIGQCQPEPFSHCNFQSISGKTIRRLALCEELPPWAGLSEPSKPSQGLPDVAAGLVSYFLMLMAVGQSLLRTSRSLSPWLCFKIGLHAQVSCAVLFDFEI